MHLDGSKRQLEAKTVAIPAHGMIEVANVAYPAKSERDPREWIYAATLAGKDIADDQALWLLAPHRGLALVQPAISASVKNGTLEVGSPVHCHGLHIEDGGHEVLADNYFDLLPGVPRRVSITAPAPSGTYSFSAIMPIERSGVPH